MSKIQRVNSFFTGIFAILIGLLLYNAPYLGVDIISFLMSVTLIYLGVKRLYFYFTMGRHMVGGKASLFVGLILLDLGIFAYMIHGFPPIYIMLYILIVHSFYGIVDIMNAIQAVKMRSKSWRLKLITGVGNLGLGIAAMVLGLTGEDVFKVIYIYALGMAYSGIMRIINSFRRTAVPYIQ